jgi:hypothetical protein
MLRLKLVRLRLRLRLVMGSRGVMEMRVEQVRRVLNNLLGSCRGAESVNMVFKKIKKLLFSS